MTLIQTDSNTDAWAGLVIPVGLGSGMLYAATTFPVTAPLPASLHPKAMATHAFSRSFGQVWGVTIGSTVVQSQLSKKLPAGFLNMFRGGEEVAYAAIPVVGSLAEPLRSVVRDAFTESLRVLWQVLTGLCGLGFIVSIFMGVHSLAVHTDENWGMVEKGKKDDDEK